MMPWMAVEFASLFWLDDFTKIDQSDRELLF